jgi:hypothetical protein
VAFFISKFCAKTRTFCLRTFHGDSRRFDIITVVANIVTGLRNNMDSSTNQLDPGAVGITLFEIAYMVQEAQLSSTPTERELDNSNALISGIILRAKIISIESTVISLLSQKPDQSNSDLVEFMKTCRAKFISHEDNIQLGHDVYNYCLNLTMEQTPNDPTNIIEAATEIGAPLNDDSGGPSVNSWILWATQQGRVLEMPQARKKFVELLHEALPAPPSPAGSSFAANASWKSRKIGSSRGDGYSNRKASTGSEKLNAQLIGSTSNSTVTESHLPTADGFTQQSEPVTVGEAARQNEEKVPLISAPTPPLLPPAHKPTPTCSTASCVLS